MEVYEVSSLLSAYIYVVVVSDRRASFECVNMTVLICSLIIISSMHINGLKCHRNLYTLWYEYKNCQRQSPSPRITEIQSSLFVLSLSLQRVPEKEELDSKKDCVLHQRKSWYYSLKIQKKRETYHYILYCTYTIL